MKLNRYIPVLFAAFGLAVSCSNLDKVVPESGTMLASQLKETNAAVPSRSSASFAGLFNPIGQPNFYGYATPDDFGVLMILFCNDLESADATASDNNYNWFSVCGEYSSRNAAYRNPVIRYRTPYSIIANVNDFLAGFNEDETNPDIVAMMGQAKALRAYAYMFLASDFQFNYTIAKDKPCVPICSPSIEDPAQNPRATVGEIYDIIMSDLDDAIAKLEGFSRANK